MRRGLDVVAADLAALGYDTSWICLRASDIGAAHRRDRLFLLAARPDFLRRHGDLSHGEDAGGDVADAVRP